MSVNTIGFEFVGKSDTSDIEKDLKNVGKSLDQAAKKLDDFQKKNKSLRDVAGNLKDKLLETSAASAVFVGAIAAAGFALAKTISAAADYGNELQKMSNRTGETVEELSRLKFAAEQEDVSLQEVAGSLRIVSRQAAAAKDGSKEATQAFKDLGVEVEDASGNLKSGKQLLEEIGEGLKKIPPGTERTAAGMKVLGRSAQAIIPLVTNLKELDERAEHLGLTVSGKFGRDADEFGDRMDELKAITQRAGVSIAQVFLPSINDLLELFTEGVVGPFKDFNDAMGELGFRTTKTTNLIIAMAASVDIFSRQVNAFGKPKFLGGQFTEANNKAIEESRKILAKASEQASLTREEYEKLAKAEGQAADDGEEHAKQVKSTADQFADLAKRLTENETAIAPVVELAEKLAGGLFEMNPQMRELVAELEKMASAGPAAAGGIAAVGVSSLAQIEKINQLKKSSELAAKALREVLGIQAAAQQREAVPSFAEIERQGLENQALETPAQRRARLGPTRESGVQGPLTEAQAGGTGGQLQATNITENLQEAPALMEETATAAEAVQAALLASELASSGMNETLAKGNEIISGATFVADQLTGALEAAATGAAGAFGDFFKGLLKQLASAIVRATILQAILGAFGGGFSLAAIGKQIKSSLGIIGFAHQESSILGRASQARGLEALAGPSFAGGGTENVMTLAKSPEVVVHEPGPFTMIEVTDRGVIPRMRTRQRRLNEEPF